MRQPLPNIRMVVERPVFRFLDHRKHVAEFRRHRFPISLNVLCGEIQHVVSLTSVVLYLASIFEKTLLVNTGK